MVEAEEQELKQLSSFCLINSEMRRYCDWLLSCLRESKGCLRPPKSCQEATIISLLFVSFIFSFVSEQHAGKIIFKTVNASKLQIQLNNICIFFQLFET